ncbi:MAG: hypothetical protein KC613_12380 [Myxococcales bacterium]|nr:hypothetical protein [Myxococcales bacterium]
MAAGAHRRRALFVGYGVVVAAAVAARLAAGIAAAPRLYFEAGDAPVAALSLAGHYAGLLVQPESRALYDHLPVARFSGWTALGLAVLVAGLGLAWRLRRDGLAGFGLLVAGLCLAPVLHLVPIPALAAERYLYLPLAGLAWGVAAAVDRVGPRLAAVVAGAALAFGALSAVRALDWRSEVELWGAEIERPAAGYKAWQNLAVALAERKAWPEATGAILRAQALRPQDPRLLRNAVRITAAACPAWPERGAVVGAALANPPDRAGLAQALPTVPCAPMASAVSAFLGSP